MDLSPDEECFQGRLLHQAALWDNLELLQELVAGGAQLDARDSQQRTALHAAALAERSRCLRALCAAGADVHARSDEHSGAKTALHIAAERGHAENVRALLGAGAAVGALSGAGDTPLALAERGRHRHAALALREARDALDRERLSQHSQLRELVTRGDASVLVARLDSLGAAAGIVANLTPGGANTLLYVASELGARAAVAALVAAGADGRAHPVTRYGPLYIACYHGHADIARLLLERFPEAVQQETVEKWLPLHAACIGGHPALVTLLLDYPYPEHILSVYTDVTGKWQYRFAFDVNARDASGQTALYVACTLGNAAVVDALLSHTVPVYQTESEEQPPAVVSPQRAGISLGIHAIVSKLTGSKPSASEPTVRRVRAVRLEAARGADSCVACAARLNHVRVLRRLLDAGARADATAAPPHQAGGESSREVRRRSRSASVSRSRASASPSPARASYGDDRDGPWTALAIAARAKNVQVVEILLAACASDPGGRALRECARHGLAELMAALLATKAYPDPDYKINKSVVSAAVLSARDADPALSYSARCPTTAVMVNWRELRCQLAQIKMSWIRAAALRVNPRVSAASSAALALTRLEIANNELRLLPRELFSMLSLRYLNAAQNKLERLPTAEDPFEEEAENRRSKSKKHKRNTEVYTAPVLQELYLQDNRLEELPPELFSLPALTSLDVSNNKLRALPPQMWQAPVLRDLNAALNHLRELPTGDEGLSDSQSASSPCESSPNASPSLSSPPFAFDQSKSSSRSPSIEVSESSPDDGDDVPTLGNRAGNAVWSEARRAHAWRGARASSPVRAGAGAGAGAEAGAGGALSSLNLAHNQFSCVPAPLACRAPALTRLNMAYNNLRSMSFVTSYPTSLRQLDLSHNEITCWPSLPQVENFGSSEGDPLACYCPSKCARARPRSSGSVRSQLLSAACPARRHLRLEGLRTLILANNMLSRIQLTTDDDGLVPASEPDGDENDDEWSSRGSLKARLLFPLLSMLDVSSNLLRAVPPALHLLANLSVLNLSGNKDITDLPPQMGLLTRLWNLNTVGCSLQEPLRSVVRGGRCRSVDVVGYLRSVLQEAKPYARMKLMIVGVQGIGKTSLLECLRQESAIQHRRKPTEHWAKRMGNKSSRRGVSTVGVDIGAWVYEPQRSARGPVTFRTWDFGGQQEYYATHQYFLSKRSLYLVVWKVSDGRKGLAAALQWLRSIQARAPGSPVIMVATHYDQVAHSTVSSNESPVALQRLIRGAVMAAPDADKLGLPRVLDSIEVSCSTRHNIKLLADIIYSVAFSVKPPGSKEPLLEQRVPATYLALEECVHSLAADLKEPVLRHDQYRRLVTQYMQQRNLRMFRDAAELHQASMFLHENGVLLHYDDATLKELYFLRPQWLCDVLAHVVTVREINPFANNGIMKVDDLAHVFKASPVLGGGEEARSLGVSLLNKFELALCWDARSLLVPPLLPDAEPERPQLALKSRAWPGTPRRAAGSLSALAEPARGTDSPLLIQESSGAIAVSSRASGRSIRRLLLLSYVPRGFWARLCARVLADPALALHSPNLYTAPREMEIDDNVVKALELNWCWKLWKTGLKLVCGPLTLLALRELPPRYDPLLGAVGDEDEPDELYHAIRFRVRQEGVWCELDVQSSACVEVLLPAEVCIVKREDGLPIGGCQSISLEPNPEVLTKVLALISDHVDLLLEDWYPSLGTRFVHTSEGRCLITRVAPCPACLRDFQSNADHEPHDHHHHDHEKQLAQVFRRLELGNAEPRRLRLSEESRASDGDSGVGAESNTSSRMGSTEGVCNGNCFVATCWTLEECVLAACTTAPLRCPHHADVQLADVAPDTLLLDVEEHRRARWEHVWCGALAGRGAFGTVLTGAWRRPGAKPEPVAVKALQPVAPPSAHDLTAMQAYKAAVSRWERDAWGAACRAYCGLRQELGILSRLRHAHVLPLVAVCAAPLALLLAVAPQGSLESVLRRYRGCGARVGPRTARALALQVARALEYLHAHRVLYRDLKSENVLVWSLPAPQEALAVEHGADAIDVHVKLGDYGISRLAPPSGTKGFGGTEGFMAPEIMRYNGEEEYTEKVDCFSYGMLLYEIFTLRQPFEGHEAVKEAVLEGARPPLSPRDLQYPCSMLETMRRCWSGAPEWRPSAAALVAVCAAPEFLALRDAAAARPARAAAPAPARRLADEGADGWEVWYGGAEPERAHTLLATPTAFTHHHTLRVPPDNSEPVVVTAMCRVGVNMWLADSVGRLFVYSISTCALSWSVRLHEAVGGAPSAVAALHHLAPLPRLAIALACGRLFIVTSERPEAEGSFVLTELGTATELCCLASVGGDDRSVTVVYTCRLFIVTSERPEAEGSFVLTELGTATELCCLASVGGDDRSVTVVYTCRLFIVTSERPEAEGSFVLTELGTATELCCLASVGGDDRSVTVVYTCRLFIVTSERPEAEGSFVLTELGTATELCCLASVGGDDRSVTVVYTCRLFIVTSERPEAEGSFVLTELGTATELCCLASVGGDDRSVTVVYTCRLFIVTSERPEAEGSFVLTELGTATELCCLASVGGDDRSVTVVYTCRLFIVTSERPEAEGSFVLTELGTATELCCLASVGGDDRSVTVVYTCRLFIVTSERPEAEGSFVLTELGTATELCCLASVGGDDRSVTVVYTCRLFIVTSERPEAEGSFVLTELGTATELCCLASVGGDDRSVTVVYTCRLFIVTSERPEAEGSFVLTELGTATELCCLASVGGDDRSVTVVYTCRLFIVTSERPEAEGSFVLTELGTATELCCLASVGGDDRSVTVVYTCRLFIVTSERPEAEGSFVLTELGTATELCCLASVGGDDRSVTVVYTCRLFIVTSERPEAEGSFVLTELGTATELCCLASVGGDDSTEVWAGGDRLYTYTVTADGVSAAESLPAPAPGKLALLAAARGPVVLGSCSPGVFVYAWCAQTRRASARLDCSKLAPCSESLQSIALDECLNEERCRTCRCQVTALCTLGDEVYVGTAWGCVVVAHAASLRPLTVFRPYEEEVRAIVPLLPHGAARDALLATFGAGYRPLVQRYAPAQSNNTTTHTGFYCLLWRAQHWLPD
ncbi:leucine-rich repeat serine/threonine-protein kinase 1 isoform X2 [Bicyclus anynana]|uniref:non-specific serine/threonine protein kinase n=1 Tax=Bicyclus anynana TaxID=110368 RepID=A0ABM3M2U0_BICAN|nr:leucine-rich repeat serine/threonine-protein kinase 1 isoform X2 [Bicyclus anynana]